MNLRIVTPENIVFEADGIDGVFAKSTDGEIGILPRHIPMVTPLTAGTLRYQQGSQKFPVQVNGGLLHTDGHTVSVLATSASLGHAHDNPASAAAQPGRH